MVFMDGSALGATLKKHYRDIGSRDLRPEASIDYERLGALVCGQGREFIRLSYYTSKPAFYTHRKLPGGGSQPVMGDIELFPHEVHNADRAQTSFQELRDHIDRRCRYTTLLNGRMVPIRVKTTLDPALTWAEQLWGVIGSQVPEDEALFTEYMTTARKSLELQHQVCERLVTYRNRRLVPREFMPMYSMRLSELIGQYIEYREKGVDTNLAVDMLALCMDDAYDDAVLFAADEDYIPLAKAVMKTGRCVINAFLEIPGNAAYGYQLRSACDAFRQVSRAELARLILLPNQIPQPIGRTCRACCEQVADEATRCSHCGELLEAGTA
jgi:Uncharacterized conserved protein